MKLKPMKEVMAQSGRMILIYGETGCGKTVVLNHQSKQQAGRISKFLWHSMKTLMICWSLSPKPKTSRTSTRSLLTDSLTS